MNSVFRGVFLTSENPAETANFYKKVVGLELEQIGTPGNYVYWKTDRAGMQIAIHDAKHFADYTSPAFPNSNLTHLYFTIASQKEFLDHVRALGIDPHSIDDVVVTVADPDGRKVMFGTA